MSTRGPARLATLSLLLSACGPGSAVPIEAAPRTATDADAPTRADVGATDSAAPGPPAAPSAPPAASAPPAPDPLDPDAVETVREPPGLVEGAAADALRTLAQGAIIEVDVDTDVLTFVPLAGQAPGAPAVLTPRSLGGWDAEPMPLVLTSVSPGDGAAYFFRGGDLLTVTSVGWSAAEFDGYGREFQDNPPPSGMNSATNGLYRVALNGADAEAPRVLARGLWPTARPARSEFTHRTFLSLKEGLAVLSDDGSDEPHVFLPNLPGRGYTLISISESFGRLVIAQRDSESNFGRLVSLFTLPVDDLDAAPTPLHRFDSGADDRPSFDPLHVRVLSDRWLLVLDSVGLALVVDVSAANAPHFVADSGVQLASVVGGDRLVYTQRAGGGRSPDETRIYAQRLGGRPVAEPTLLDLGDAVVAGDELVTDPQGESLILGQDRGIVVVPVDGGPRTTYAVAHPERRGTSQVATDPTGRTLLQVTDGRDGLGVVSVPRSTGAARVVVAPEPDISGVGIRAVSRTGRMLVFREHEDQTTVSRVDFEGHGETPISLLGRLEWTASVPEGVVVNTRVGGHRLDATTTAAPETLFASPSDLRVFAVAPGSAFAWIQEFFRNPPGPVALVDLRRPEPPERLESRTASWFVRALRSAAAVVSRSLGLK